MFFQFIITNMSRQNACVIRSHHRRSLFYTCLGWWVIKDVFCSIRVFSRSYHRSILYIRSVMCTYYKRVFTRLWFTVITYVLWLWGDVWNPRRWCAFLPSATWSSIAAASPKHRHVLIISSLLLVFIMICRCKYSKCAHSTMYMDVHIYGYECSSTPSMSFPESVTPPSIMPPTMTTRTSFLQASPNHHMTPTGIHSSCTHHQKMMIHGLKLTRRPILQIVRRFGGIDPPGPLAQPWWTATTEKHVDFNCDWPSFWFSKLHGG